MTVPLKVSTLKIPTLPKRRALDIPIRPTRAEISQSALLHNLEQTKRWVAPVPILAVVKANAYGHGAVDVARTLEAGGIWGLAVALVEEGIELRQTGIRARIVVMGGAYEGAWPLMVAHKLTPTLFRREHLRGFGQLLRSRGEEAEVHIKIDTGMGRNGVVEGELEAFVEELKAWPELRVEGLCTHLACAEQVGAELTALQLQRFEKALGCFQRHGINPAWRHIANTAATLSMPQARDGRLFNLVRPGGAIYGLFPKGWPKSLPLKRVLSWKTGITHLKWLSPGDSVSYDATWRATQATCVATLPVGYADGFGRDYSNKGEILLRGRRAGVIGRVAMDFCLVDVTSIEGAAVGDEVTLLGEEGEECLDADGLAERIGSLHYEVLCGIGARVPRILVE
ncbi:MAG: alanine racemase [Proteobacteria bacterium]|nr:alanine racemase [Cystobacterineae bacterium]MCL2259449.1 alanine racemase [Cystobacterineae bacterium]MCL2314090.1 alanine racemase [Pseudomonadota bacterium]